MTAFSSLEIFYLSTDGMLGSMLDSFLPLAEGLLRDRL